LNIDLALLEHLSELARMSLFADPGARDRLREQMADIVRLAGQLAAFPSSATDQAHEPTSPPAEDLPSEFTSLHPGGAMPLLLPSARPLPDVLHTQIACSLLEELS
jgi:hypothetical protein